MECCSKSDEKIDDGGERGEPGVARQNRGVTSPDLAGSENLSLFLTFYCCVGSYCKAYHSLAALLIELTFWSKISQKGKTYKTNFKFKPQQEIFA